MMPAPLLGKARKFEYFPVRLRSSPSGYSLREALTTTTRASSPRRAMGSTRRAARSIIGRDSLDRRSSSGHDGSSTSRSSSHCSRHHSPGGGGGCDARKRRLSQSSDRQRRRRRSETLESVILGKFAGALSYKSESGARSHSNCAREMSNCQNVEKCPSVQFFACWSRITIRDQLVELLTSSGSNFTHFEVPHQYTIFPFPRPPHRHGQPTGHVFVSSPESVPISFQLATFFTWLTLSSSAGASKFLRESLAAPTETSSETQALAIHLASR